MKIQLIPVQTIILSIFLTAPSIVVPQSAEAASLFCHQTLEANNPVPWRLAKGDLFMGFRSNAAHFWNWVREQNLPALHINGIVIGDAHILNFRDVPLENGKRAFALVDIDDAGIGSLWGDFLRFYVGNQLSPYKVNGKKLWDAYLDGLNNVQADKPEVINKVENKDYTLDDHMDWVDKYTSQKKFNDNAELLSLADAPAAIKGLFKTADPAFRRELPGEVLDIGYKINDEGGSQGMVRFWYLLRNGKTLHIYEFKQEPAPAPASYGPQPSRVEAFDQAAALYRPENPSGLQKMLNVKSEHFLMRERQKTELNFDPSKATEKTTAQAKELSFYIANDIGLKQHAQTAAGEALKAELQKDPQIFERLSALAESYIALAMKENK